MLTVGVDVGGTTVKSALIEVGDAREPSSYRILGNAVVKTEKGNGREGVLCSITEAVWRVVTDEVVVVGVGSAGDVEPDTGIVKFATDALPGFTGLNLYEALLERLQKPVVVINDASAATVGECYFGGGRGYSRVLVLTLGTGLGCSLYTANGDGLTAETVVNFRLGHLELHKGGRKCLCNLRGCAEQYVSATALRKNAKDVGISGDANDLMSAYRQGETRAVKAVKRFFRDFTDVLRYAEQTYAPELVLVGGGVTEIGGWWEDFTEYAAREVHIPVKAAELKNKAGFLGAVFNALNGKYKQQKGVQQ